MPPNGKNVDTREGEVAHGRSTPIQYGLQSRMLWLRGQTNQADERGSLIRVGGIWPGGAIEGKVITLKEEMCRCELDQSQYMPTAF